MKRAKKSTGDLSLVEMSPASRAKIAAASPPVALADLSLPELAEAYGGLDRLEREYENMSGICAVLKGCVLLEVKPKTNRQFKSWVKTHFPKSYRTAARYMRLAEEFGKSASAVTFQTLTRDLASSVEALREFQLDLSHPMVGKVAKWVKGRGSYQLMLDLGACSRGGDNAPRDENGKRTSKRRRAKAEIEREEFEEEAFESCRDTAKALTALLKVEGPEEECAWVVLSDADLEKLRADLFEAYTGVKECQAGKKRAKK